MGITAWHHTSLAVSDLNGAIEFYVAAFGFKVAFRENGMTDQIRSMTGDKSLVCDIAQLRHDRTGHVLELIHFHGRRRADTRPVRPGAGHVAFYVDNLEAMLDQVAALGARRIGSITKFSDGRCVYCREPSGSFFEMEELKRA